MVGAFIKQLWCGIHEQLECIEYQSMNCPMTETAQLDSVHSPFQRVTNYLMLLTCSSASLSFCRVTGRRWVGSHSRYHVSGWQCIRCSSSKELVRPPNRKDKKSEKCECQVQQRASGLSSFEKKNPKHRLLMAYVTYLEVWTWNASSNLSEQWAFNLDKFWWFNDVQNFFNFIEEHDLLWTVHLGPEAKETVDNLESNITINDSVKVSTNSILYATLMANKTRWITSSVNVGSFSRNWTTQ